jgi:pimeloyl-ACP methyl ester carboxylesterase
MSSELSQQIRFCAAPDGVNIAYATTGAGYPIVRVGHYLTHLSFDLESPVWRHWIRELSRGHQLIRYDERGLGLSDWKVPDFSFDGWVRDLETVVDSLGLERFALLGVSQGGPVSIAYTARHPERVSHLVLCGSYALGWAKRPQRPEDAEIRASMHQLMKVGWGRDEPTFRQLYTSMFIPGATPEQARWFNELQRVSCPTENAVRFDEAFAQIDVLAFLPKIAVPTLILHAREDLVVPFDMGRQLAALIPGSKFVPLDGRNHVLLESDPAWPAFLHALRAFVGGSDAPTALAGEAEVSLTPANRQPLEELLRDSQRFSVPDFRVVGSYVRYDATVRHHLKDLRQRIVTGLQTPTLGRENYLVWGRPGSGKTFLVQQIARALGPSVEYRELNLARLEEANFRSELARLADGSRPLLCLIDEVDARPNESWPYEALLPYLEPVAGEPRSRTFVLAGSSASNLREMKERLEARPKGPDLVSRIPASHEFTVPPLTTEDRMAVVLVQLDGAARELGRSVREVEKLALYYVITSDRFASPRQLRELAVRCVERLPPGDDRIKYDHFFAPGDPENKAFWLASRPAHAGLVDAFLAITE